MINNPEFQALRREYIAGAVDRRAILAEAATRLATGAEVDLKVLRQEIHKFRGSGGFYGFRTLSEASGAAEDQLVMTIDGDIERNDATLAVLVQKVVAALQAAADELNL